MQLHACSNHHIRQEHPPHSPSTPHQSHSRHRVQYIEGEPDHLPLGAGFGPGLLSCRAADLRNEGKSAQEAGEILDDEVKHLLQIFTVDDLNFLKRTGRVSGATATSGTILNIKPLLWGDPTGHIVALSKCRGRKKAIEAIVEIYRTRGIDVQNQRVAISHGDCLEEAQLLADKICEICKPKELIICPHEPFTGAHVGPGMLALFFFGEER